MNELEDDIKKICDHYSYPFNAPLSATPVVVSIERKNLEIAQWIEEQMKKLPSQYDVIEAVIAQMSTQFDGPSSIMVHPLDALKNHWVKRYPRKYKKMLKKSSRHER